MRKGIKGKIYRKAAATKKALPLAVVATLQQMGVAAQWGRGRRHMRIASLVEDGSSAKLPLAVVAVRGSIPWW
jgi:hypothetical protein